MARVRWGSVIKSVVSGSVLTNDKFVRRLPIFVVVAILALIYMYVGFTVHRKHEYLSKLKSEVVVLRTTSITTSAQRQALTRRDNIERLIQKYKLDITQSETPPNVVLSGQE